MRVSPPALRVRAHIVQAVQAGGRQSAITQLAKRSFGTNVPQVDCDSNVQMRSIECCGLPIPPITTTPDLAPVVGVPGTEQLYRLICLRERTPGTTKPKTIQCSTNHQQEAPIIILLIIWIFGLSLRLLFLLVEGQVIFLYEVSGFLCAEGVETRFRYEYYFVLLQIDLFVAFFLYWLLFVFWVAKPSSLS